MALTFAQPLAAAPQGAEVVQVVGQRRLARALPPSRVTCSSAGNCRNSSAQAGPLTDSVKRLAWGTVTVLLTGLPLPNKYWMLTLQSLVGSGFCKVKY